MRFQRRNLRESVRDADREMCPHRAPAMTLRRPSVSRDVHRPWLGTENPIERTAANCDLLHGAAVS
jgi:hypothetical protein